MTDHFIVLEGDRVHTIVWADVGRVQYLPEVIILGFKNRKMMIDSKGRVTFGTLIRGMTFDRFEEDGEGTTDPSVQCEAWVRFPNASPASDRVQYQVPKPPPEGCKKMRRM